MINALRDSNNPLISPQPKNSWEAAGAFNGSIVKDNDIYHLVYRAIGKEQDYRDTRMRQSTIGYTQSTDGVHFGNRRKLISPYYEWEKYGCEDPRVTKLGDTYYIFYTALSDYPHTPLGIKLAVALTKNFKTIDEKHLVTPFNAKAMALFPEKINGKYTAILTAHTDFPPAKIAIAQWNKISDIWSRDYWQEWQRRLDQHTLPLMRLNHDHVEFGVPPLKTDRGWLVVYAHIQNYGKENTVFGIEAVLLAHDKPEKIIGRTIQPLLIPETPYEKEGMVANVIFPSGGIIEKGMLQIYYGTADTYVARAAVSLSELLSSMQNNSSKPFTAHKLTRFEHNPLLHPQPNHYWEAQAVMNPAAFAAEEKVHIIYRALSPDNTSSLGYAVSPDGVHIAERLIEPIYLPRMEFEDKKQRGANSGCEDPRVTKIGDTLYLCYTAYDGVNPPRVALSSISYNDFSRHRFMWKKPVLITPPGVDDKNACIFPETVNGKYIILHRVNNEIVMDFVQNLDFGGEVWLKGDTLTIPRKYSWDDKKIGAAAPPIKTNEGWLLLYHGLSNSDHEYRVGAMILELNNPINVLYRTRYPILEPITQFERVGLVPNVVFPCGSVVVKDMLYVYYGSADTVVSVSYGRLSDLLSYIKQSPV